MGEKKPNAAKRFFGEFKTFITRGNVVDMAVGVIVGGAFTAIVNGLSNYILKPLINWLLAFILGKDGFSEIITKLSMEYQVIDGVVQNGENGTQVLYDLANSIYLDWGAFISAIINFFIIAFVLFIIVKMINNFRDANKAARTKLKSEEKKAIRAIRKAQKVSKEEAKEIYAAQLAAAAAAKAEEERIAAEKAAEEARLAEEKAMANTKLLAEIRDLLKQK